MNLKKTYDIISFKYCSKSKYYVVVANRYEYFILKATYYQYYYTSD